MQQSNPTLLVSRALLLKVWQRKAVNLIAGKPHMVALLLPIVVAYGFFAWQARQLIAPFAGMMSGATEQAGFTALVAGLTFAVIASATWFLARQTIEVNVPPNLRALPITNRTWLRSQSILFVAAMWGLNSLVTMPLFVALGRQQDLNLIPWLVFVELALLFYILIGFMLYVLTEHVVRLDRFRKIYSSLSSLHTIGQIAVVAWAGYQRLFGSPPLNRLNAGLETKYFLDMVGGWQLLLPFAVIFVGIALLAWGLSFALHGFKSSVAQSRSAKPLSAWLLTPQPSRLGTIFVTVWRVILSDHEVTLPNLLIIGAIVSAVIAVRLRVFSEAVGLVVYSIYNVLFLLLFSGWAISIRGRLGTSRRVVYALPIAPRSLVIVLGGVTLVSVVLFYVLVEVSLMLLFGQVVGETSANIAKNTVMLSAAASLTFALGTISYAGQKNKLNQVPVAVGFAIVNILGLVLLAWLNGKYGAFGLVAVAGICVLAAMVASTKYERGHLLDEA